MYDYYGVCLRTHEDEECTDMMEEVFYTKGLFDNKGITIGAMLLEDDRCLLEEYAPLLFNTLPNDISLYETMLKLVTLIRDYRQNVAYGTSIKSMKDLSPTHKNKDDEKKNQAFRKNLVGLCNMMGGTMAGTKLSFELKEMLKDAYDTPENYLIHRPKAFTASIKPIENYIIGLNLPNKKTHRENFIKAIDA